jgi:hypothetical protein
VTTATLHPPPPPHSLVVVVVVVAVLQTLNQVVELKAKYSKDVKRCIKLEVAQDKLMELRLKQAKTTNLAMASDPEQQQELKMVNKRKDQLKRARSKKVFKVYRTN